MATLTTPSYSFPYPDGTERVMDGDNAMGALGLSIENLLKTLPAWPGMFTTGSAFTIPQNPPVVIPGITASITPTQSELIFIIFMVDVIISTADPGVITSQLFVDGVATRSITHQGAAGTRSTGTGFHLINAAAGPHTFEVRTGKANAGGAAVANPNSLMTFIRWRR